MGKRESGERSGEEEVRREYEEVGEEIKIRDFIRQGHAST